jgi:hypothetical protein
MSADQERERAERRRFVETNRTAIYGYPRRDDAPSMTVVYYQLHGDDLLVTTMASRAKARVGTYEERASLCVLDEKWPMSYVLLFCTAKVEDKLEATVDAMMNVREIMAGSPMPDTVRPVVEQTARDEGRVVIRLRPHHTFTTAPQHVYRPEDNANIVHPPGALLPW